MDSQKWTARYCGHSASNGGGTCHNNESQYFVPEAVTLNESGKAVITAKKISSVPQTGLCLGKICNFTSGRFDTQGKVSFMYGLIESRIKVPSGSGNWPAFWMLGDNITDLGWPKSGEIDIMEQWRFETQRTSAATHYPDRLGSHRFDVGEISLNYDFSQDFHIYSLVWMPDVLEFYVDGILFFKVSKSGSDNCNYTAANVLKPNCTAQTDAWPFNQYFFMIFNNAISDQASSFNKWDGWETSEMAIDYVRVYTVNSFGTVKVK